MRPGRRTTRPRCCIWRCVSRGLTLRHKAAGHTLSSRLGLPQGSGMEGSLDSAHSVRCARDDRGRTAAFAALGMTKDSPYHPLGSGRERSELMCPGFCPVSVSVTANCEWGMEETVLGMPLVVENRPFMLDVRKSERDLLRCLGRICGLRDGSARKRGQVRRGWRGRTGGRSEAGAEPQVNGIKRGKWGFRRGPKIGVALVRIPCHYRALSLFLAGNTVPFYVLPRLAPRFIVAGQSISNDGFGAFPALGSAPVFWTARGFWV